MGLFVLPYRSRDPVLILLTIIAPLDSYHDELVIVEDPEKI